MSCQAASASGANITNRLVRLIDADTVRPSLL
jgi:hypothetical protein